MIRSSTPQAVAFGALYRHSNNRFARQRAMRWQRCQPPQATRRCVPDFAPAPAVPHVHRSVHRYRNSWRRRFTNDSSWSTRLSVLLGETECATAHLADNEKQHNTATNARSRDTAKRKDCKNKRTNERMGQRRTSGLTNDHTNHLDKQT